MNARHHRLYLESVLALAKTLVIKSEYSAEQINNQVALRFGAASVDTTNKASWKYYLNVAGQYHATDTKIRVKSLDTMETIDFTRENLVVHTATARGYMPGTRYYKELLLQYPNDRLLIHGILFPADLQKAVAAPDFSVLSYVPSLVEPNEEDLIANINEWLRLQAKRWYVQAFNLTEEHYAAAFLGPMYQQLAALIMVLRRKACKTSQAHSYHVRQFLLSHGMLEAYLEHLTQKQLMFFYRNIRYIHRHAGKEDTFNWLTDNVLTPRNMPLAQYDAVHMTAAMPQELAPAVVFRSRALSKVPSMARQDLDVAGILSKEVPLAPGNLEEANFSQTAIAQAFTYTQTALHPTKMLESASVQTSTGSARNIQDAALNLWAYAASTGRYNSYVLTTDPVTGAELSMPALVAYHYFTYAFYKAHNLSLTTVPPVVAAQVPKWPGSSLERLMKLVDTKELDEEVVFGIWNLHPQDRSFPNTDSFADAAESLLQIQNNQLLYTSLPESVLGRGMAQAVYEALYPTYIYENSATGTNLKEYFAPYDLVVDGLDQLQWQQLYLNLFNAATGQSMTSVQTRTAMQETMVAIMARLSSYSVQFVSEVASSEMHSVAWQSLRVSPGVNSARLYYWLAISALGLEPKKITASPRYKVEMTSLFNRLKMRAPNRVTEVIDVNLQIINVTNTTLNTEALIAFDGVRMLYDRAPGAVIMRPEDIPGMDHYNGYSTEQLMAMADVYAHQCRTYPTVPSKVSLEDKFNNFNLPIFKALEARNTLLRAWTPYSVAGSLRYYRNEVFVVVLNAFESNWGDLQVQAFEPTVGRDLLKMFTYIPDFIITDAPEFTYTGSPYKLGTMVPGDTDSDIVGPSFKPVVKTSFKIDLKPSTGPHAVVVDFSQALPAISVGFKQSVSTVVLSFASRVRTIRLDPLKGTIPSIVINVAQARRALQLPLFTTVNRTILVPVFQGRSRGYQLPVFKQTFISQGPVLTAYGFQVLPAIKHTKPVTAVADAISLEFQPKSRVVAAPELKFSSGAKTIDIPNFEDLFKTL